MDERFKLLIGYDGSDCAEAAIDDLRKAGLPQTNVEAHALAVADVFMLPPPPPSSYETTGTPEAEAHEFDRRRYARNLREMQEAEELARRAGERLRGNFPGWDVTAEAVNGSPAWELVAAADRRRPDLVVVGSQGRSALGRLVMGSVSQRVLAEAKCSVRVARGRAEVDRASARLVVGVDGSNGAAAAVRAVAARRWPEGSEARVVVAQTLFVPAAAGGLMPPAVGWIESENEAERKHAREIAERAAAELAAAGLKTSTSVAEGDPKRVLAEEAEAWGADCIFVGSTGFSNRVERFLLGSVSAAVAARAHCSVEVVREPAR